MKKLGLIILFSITPLFTYGIPQDSINFKQEIAELEKQIDALEKQVNGFNQFNYINCILCYGG